MSKVRLGVVLGLTVIFVLSLSVFAFGREYSDHHSSSTGSQYGTHHAGGSQYGHGKGHHHEGERHVGSGMELDD